MGEVLDAAENLVRLRLGDLAAQLDGRDVDPPSSELRRRNTQLVRNDELQDPQALLGRKGQHAVIVADHGDRRPGDLQRPRHVLRPTDLEGAGVRIDQTVSVEIQTSLGLEDALHRLVDTLFVELPFLDGADERLQRHPQVGGHQDHVGAGANGLHGGLSDPGGAHALHVHGVGHDEPLEAHLAAAGFLR